MKATAAVVWEKERPFSMEEVEVDEPRAGEVLVRIVGVGVCHTDLIVRDQWYPVPLPAVLGHEGSGVVESVGPGVEKVRPGDHVVLSFDHCGHCANCLKGRPSYCTTFFERNFGGQRMDGSTALDKDGQALHSHFFGQSSFATYALASQNSVVKVPQDAPLESLGPLGCGVQTGAGAVLNSLKPEPGSSIAVFGTGAVGISAIMAAVAAGWYADAGAAAAAMTSTAEPFQPDPEAATAYDRLYREVYVHLFPALRPYLDRLTELTR